MDVTLPSGATVVLRDKVKAADKFAVQREITLALDTNTGLQHSALGIVNDMRNALLKRLIEKWTFDFDVPSISPLGVAVLDDLDLDDYVALQEAVEPLMQKIVGVSATPNRNAPSSS